MSRFADFGLYRRTDELLRPAEKDLSGRFHSTENTQLLFNTAKTEINSRVSYSDVTRTMDAVFRIAIGNENLPTVSDMNSVVIRRLRDSTDMTALSQKRYTERAYHNNNIPTKLLPRPSYDLITDYEDDDVIELLRR